MIEKYYKNIAGTLADIKFGVDIAKVHRSYFSNLENAQKFVDLGILPYLDRFTSNLRYVDFGGGKGFLSKLINDVLIENGLNPKTIVYDANKKFLEEAKSLKLKTKFGSLQDQILIKNVDLASMRAVLHYNDINDQENILKNVYNTLNYGGILVNQASSGSYANTRLRSSIVNISELGRSPGRYCWLSVEEIIDLTLSAGFKKVKFLGYVTPCFWSPEEQWDRFHSRRSLELSSKKELKKLECERERYLEKAYSLISDYNKKYGFEDTGVVFDGNGIANIHYQYPIILAEK